MSIEERKKCVVTHNACFKCLNRNHRVDKCRSKANCSKCGGNHSSMICARKKSNRSASTSAAATVPETAVEAANAVITSGAAISKIIMSRATEKVLPTGYVEAFSNNRSAVCRLVLDTGSMKSFVTKSFAGALQAERVGRDKFHLQSAGYATTKPCCGDIVEITLKSRFSNNSITIQATALPTVINGQLPNVNFSGKLNPIADKNVEGWKPEIDILVGVDFLHQIVGTTIKKFDSLMAFDTIFGYFICGVNQGQKFRLDSASLNSIRGNRSTWNDSNNKPQVITAAVATLVKKYEPDDVSFLWDTELMGIEPYSKESDEAEAKELNKFFKETVKRAESGRYTISLPFKPNRNTLGTNRKLTELRLKGFLVQAKKDLKFLEAVDKEVESLISKGFVEAAEPPRPDQESHYLPLLAVKKAGSTPENMKIRLVNDAGARSRDEAGLNDVLHQGENLITDIVQVLLKFRQSQIAICADIEQAYLQFEITPEHRTFLRFLWPLGISKDPKAKVKEFKSCRLSFGLVSAPWLHCAGIRTHLDNEIELRPQHKELLEFVKQSFYIDDLLARASTVEEGKKVVDTLISVFDAGCFPLRKWATAAAEIGEYIKTKYPNTIVSYQNENHKLLGVRWNQLKDTLHIDVSPAKAVFAKNPPTKRSSLKGVSQIFDPLNFLIPITIAFKMQIQQLWINKYDWDESLEGDDLLTYKENANRLECATAISLERNFGPTSIKGAAARTELHIFCDSSLKGYGCVAYARKINGQQVEVTMIMAKGRVAPLKGNWSIHRLELLGAVVAVRIARKICQAAASEFTSVNFWCDNACVLAWIRDSPDRWKQFVSRRIKEIQEHSSPKQWSYIRSEENAADLIGRASPLDTDELRDFWLHGPRWLRSTDRPEEHSLNPKNVEYDLTNEMKAQCIVGSITCASATEPIGWKLLSSWPKMVRVIAYVRRWIKYKRKRITRGAKKKQGPVVRDTEFAAAEIALLKSIQLRYFGQEIASNLKAIPKSSQIYQYNPIFGEKDGLVRCKSRLYKSTEIIQAEAEPVILPGEDSLVDLYYISDGYIRKGAVTQGELTECYREPEKDFSSCGLEEQ